jgi:hypothetical protein
MTADTSVLPSRPFLEPGIYHAGPARCVLELAAVLGPVAALRRRCAVRDSRLVIASTDSLVPYLEVEAKDRKERTIRFASTSFAAADSGGLDISGELRLNSDNDDDEAVPLTLRTRVVGEGINRLLIIGTGRVRRIRFLLAADFR